MKVNITSLFILILTFFTFVSCDENDPVANLTGYWKYSQPHFEFDYETETVEIQMGQQPMILEVESLKSMIRGIAAEKMNAYFTGISMNDDRKLEIQMNIAGRPIALNADYKLDGQYLEVTLDPASLQGLTAGKALQIPAVSFAYLQQDDQLLLYFDKTYLYVLIQTILGNDQMRPMILSAIIPNFSLLPPQAQAGIAAGLNKQISDIFNRTQRLELGIRLNKTK